MRLPTSDVNQTPVRPGSSDCDLTGASSQTWEEGDPSQHLPLLAEVHHHVTHVVAGLGLQRQPEGGGHCDASDKRDTHTQNDTHTRMSTHAHRHTHTDTDRQTDTQPAAGEEEEEENEEEEHAPVFSGTVTVAAAHRG